MLEQFHGKKILVLSSSAGLLDMSARLSGLGAVVTHVDDLRLAATLPAGLLARERRARLSRFGIDPQRPEAQGLLLRLSKTADIVVNAFGDVALAAQGDIVAVSDTDSAPALRGTPALEDSDASIRTAGLSALLGLVSGDAIHLPPRQEPRLSGWNRSSSPSHHIFETMEEIGVTSAQTACLLAEGILQ